MIQHPSSPRTAAADDPSAVIEPQSGTDNHAMIAAIQQGDTRMENAFCAYYYPQVRRQLQRLNGGACIDDITQDVLITVLLRLRNDGIDQPQYLNRFVLQTARYIFLGWLRQPAQHLAERDAGNDTMAAFTVEENAERQAIRSQQQRLLAHLINSLYVERDREVLRRAYLLEQPKHTVCHAMTLSTHHFDRIIFRARQRLRTLVDAQSADIRDALSLTG